MSNMGFLHQLRLLLWKNYVLKKRDPFRVAFEVLIPLVLFLILMIISLHRTPQPHSEYEYPASALPSSGIIPLMQSFCPHQNRKINKDGFPDFPNASIGMILNNVVDIYNSPVLSGLSDTRKLIKDIRKLAVDQDFFPVADRKFKNFTIGNLFLHNHELEHFLVINFSFPVKYARGLLDAQIDSDEASKILLEKRKDILTDLSSYIDRKKTPINYKSLQKSVIAQALFDPESLRKGPSWLNLLAYFSGLASAIGLEDTDMLQNPLLETIFKKRFLGPEEIKLVICDRGEFSTVFTSKKLTEQEMISVVKKLCHATDAQLDGLSRMMQKNLNWSAVLEEMHFDKMSIANYGKRVRKIQDGINTLAEVETIINKTSDIAQKFNFNILFVRQNSSEKHQMLKYGSKIWQAVGPIICGHPEKSTTSMDDDQDIRRLFGSRDLSVRALKFMLYTLTHNPRILYAPNTTDVNRVISKAGHLLQLVKATKTYAVKWLNISGNLRSKLKDRRTQHFLKELSKTAKKFPFLYNKWSTKITRVLNRNISSVDNQVIKVNETLLKYVNLAREHMERTVNSLLENRFDQIPILKRLVQIDKVAKAWIFFLKPFNFDIFYGFPNETKLLEFVYNKTGAETLGRHVLSAVLFDNVESSGTLPKHVRYRIRFDGNLLTSTAKIRSRYWYPGPQPHERYLYYGFIWLQDSIERAITEVILGRNVTSPGVYINQLPYPCFLKDKFMFVIQYVMPLCMTISFIYSVALLVQSIVYEKEQRLKEAMKMMGLSNAVHWTAWFITSMVTLGINIMLLTIILKYGGILKYSNPSITFLFLFLSAVATTLFCFLISVFFSKAKLAAACGGIVYFITYMPYVFISIREGGSHVKLSAAWKSSASLFSTTALGLGARYFALFEQNGEGLQWDNLSTSPLLEDDFNLGQVFAMLIVDSFLYGILAWYIEAVNPGAYGLPRPWYFLFQPSYWCGQTIARWSKRMGFERLYHRMQSTDTPLETRGLHAMERDPAHLPLGVVIQNLVKIYKSGKKTAVDNLCLNLYEGQITSFLGHNGAGKTTTMSMLTGLFPPTSGTAIIYGNDIRNDMDKIRTSLGMCPQHNVLFERMTIEEHLWFYARLKGMESAEVKSETDRILEDVGLPTKRHSLVDTLSGGMQRKLSVAMAFIGGSRTIILDEPTAGVDPYARRAIWDLLVKYKQGRTILLSTHFMDEADILGDRIAIISHGKLICCGSSLFLKSQFGDGYHLTLVKNTRAEGRHGDSQSSPSSRSSPQETQPAISTQEIKKYIASFVPSAQLICETQHELSFILPDKELKKGMLRRLFQNLEENQEKLGSKSFGLTDTTLEEVFLKVTEAACNDEDSEDNDLVTDIRRPTLSPIMSVNETLDLELIENSEASIPSVTLRDDVKLPTVAFEKGHRRSFSSDFHKEKKCTSPVANTVCAHRRTPSGGYCGHRRALSLDINGDKKGKRNESTNRTFEIKQKQGHNRTPSNTSGISQSSGVMHFDDFKVSLLTNATLRWKQFYALFIKRLHHCRRNFKGVISQIFLPVLFICIAMTVALSQQGLNARLPPLILSPSMFRPPPNYIPVSNELETSEKYAKRLEDTLTLPSGVGADCVLRHSNFTMPRTFHFKTLKKNLRQLFDDLCVKQVSDSYDVVFDVKKDIYEPFNATYNSLRHTLLHSSGPKCRCSKDFSQYLCDPGVEGNPDSYTTVTRDTLLNVTGRDMQKYLKYTTFRFKRHRYGALTFGLRRDLVPDKLEDINNDDIKRLFVKHVSKAWYNNKGYHAMPTYLNVMNNAILRANIDNSKKGNPAAYGITAVNHPFNTSHSLNEESLRQGTDVVIAIFVIIAMSFVPASFVVFLVMERASKAKHLQFVSGVDPTIYWLSNYAWDMLNYMIPASACMMILYFFQVPAYSSPTNFPATCWLFILYGWSITPLMYPTSFLFKEASTAYIFMIVLNLFVGITCTVTTFILQMFPDDAPLVTAYNTVKMVFLAFPNYCLGRGLMDLAFNEYLNEYYKLVGEFDNVRSPFEWDLVTRYLLVMSIEGLAFFVVTLLIEYRFFIKAREHKPLAMSCTEGEDEDVAFERQRILSGETSDDTLIIENLTKIYRSRKRGKQLAVDNLCLGVAKGECFGLLGVNGAGKTTTFKMLTSDTLITAGKASVKNWSVIHNAARVHKHIGYCPQFDALIDEMTGREHLAFYARIRGVPEANLNQVINSSLKKLALLRYADRPSRTYSGGNKRKLSAAIALLGNPSLVFMDEPTTGMDPGARRFLWNVVLNIVQEGTKSVVLTSHSMEECEALCSRVAIMVNGRFKCIGSTQHLKNRFGEGYIVTIRVKGDMPNLEPVKSFFEEKLPDAMLKECHHNMLQYQVPSVPHIKLADVFGFMEEAEENLDVEDYSVSQTTLDNVFVNFAKQQMGSNSPDQYSTLSNSSLSRLGTAPIKDWLTSKYRKLKTVGSPEGQVEFSMLTTSDEHSLREYDIEDSDAARCSENRAQLSFYEQPTV